MSLELTSAINFWFCFIKDHTKNITTPSLPTRNNSGKTSVVIIFVFIALDI
ncbi:hypothetical protein NIES39_O00530 [Arthrospira platensis NIES-39]|nr:hypothetical protein NIES39_O00530 [Arthrospira platensis NIES-39]